VNHRDTESTERATENISQVLIPNFPFDVHPAACARQKKTSAMSSESPCLCGFPFATEVERVRDATWSQNRNVVVRASRPHSAAGTAAPQCAHEAVSEVPGDCERRRRVLESPPPPAFMGRSRCGVEEVARKGISGTSTALHLSLSRRHWLRDLRLNPILTARFPRGATFNIVRLWWYCRIEVDDPNNVENGTSTAPQAPSPKPKKEPGAKPGSFVIGFEPV